VNHTHFPKEDHLPDWARRDNKVTKGGSVERLYCTYVFSILCYLKYKWMQMLPLFVSKIVYMVWWPEYGLNNQGIMV